VLQSLGVRRGLVVSGAVSPATPAASSPAASHLDEFSTLGLNTVAEFYQDRGFATATLDPVEFPLQPARLEDLAGGSREANAAIVRGLLRGEDRGPRRDAVLLNAGAALFVAGRVRSIAEGWDLAETVIERGQAAATLADLAKS
jgi:anthranilate phosphoribosyltransferase